MVGHDDDEDDEESEINEDEVERNFDQMTRKMDTEIAKEENKKKANKKKAEKTKSRNRLCLLFCPRAVESSPRKKNVNVIPAVLGVASERCNSLE